MKQEIGEDPLEYLEYFVDEMYLANICTRKRTL